MNNGSLSMADHLEDLEIIDDIFPGKIPLLVDELSTGDICLGLVGEHIIHGGVIAGLPEG